VPRPGSELSERQRRGRSLLKRFLYSQLAQRDAFGIARGRTKPLVHFIVEADPPSVYYNFEIPAERAAELERELALPHPITPIACLEGETPFHCLTLNMYRVSGLANGIRAEWSVYVRDAGGTPRYLVVEAQADSGSIDPVRLLTRGTECTHTCSEALLESRVRDESGGHFSARLTSPLQGQRAVSTREWVEANDYIYWRNGVCDRTFYDSGLANSRTHLIDPARVETSDDTAWARWVNPEPRHVLVYEHAIEFAMSPWWNIRDRGLVR